MAAVIGEGGMIVEPPFVRSNFNYDVDLASLESGLRCDDPSLTQQQFKDECDINYIVEQFGVTGKLPIVTVQPLAGDFSGIDDYQSAVNAVKAAEQNFMALPSKIRARFGSDPKKFVDFCLDPGNIEAVREMGLAPRPAAPVLSEIVKNGEGNASGNA